MADQPRGKRGKSRRLCKWDAAESMRVGEYIKVAYIDAEKACRIVELRILLYSKDKWSKDERRKNAGKNRGNKDGVGLGINRDRTPAERRKREREKKGSRDEERGENEREKIN